MCCQTQECQFALICTTCMLRNPCVTCTDGDRGQGLGKNSTSWQWKTQRTAWHILHNICVLRSRALNAADGWRHWERESSKIYEQKQPKQQEENERKCKRKKHVVESLHKPDINYAHFHFRFNHSPRARCMHNAHICTCTVQRKASCTCILLVIRMFLLARSYFILAFLALS